MSIQKLEKLRERAWLLGDDESEAWYSAMIQKLKQQQKEAA